MPNNKPYILSTGSYLPKKVLTNQELEGIVETSDEWIVTRTGIKQRHIASKNQVTSDLAYEASVKALESAKLKPTDLDMIITATITPDQLMPTTSCVLQDKLKARKVMSFDLQAACSGFLYALHLAEQSIKNGASNILIIGADILSRITNYKDRETCILFGDGAGAAIVAQSKSDSIIIDSIMQADGSLGKYVTLLAGGSRMPCSKKALELEAQYVNMKGRELFKYAVRAVVDICHEILNKNKIKLSDIDWIIPHQANTRIIETAMGNLNFPMEKTALNIDHAANTSAATIPIALDEFVRRNKIQRGSLVLMISFGGGFTSGATLMRY